MPEFYARKAAGLLEALVVLPHLQNLQRASALAPVCPDTLEGPRAVVQGVRCGRQPNIAHLYELAVVVGPLRVRSSECSAAHRVAPPVGLPADASSIITSAARALSSAPTLSTCNSASRRRMARKLAPPAWFSKTHSFANLPLWISVRISRIRFLTLSSMRRGPEV